MSGWVSESMSGVLIAFENCFDLFPEFLHLDIRYLIPEIRLFVFGDVKVKTKLLLQFLHYMY